MLDIHIITVHPSLIDAYQSFGVFRQASSKGLGAVYAVNLRDYAVDRHGSVDDKPFGGGDGMVLRPEPLAAAVDGITSPYVLVTSPAGKRWDQNDAMRLAKIDRPLVIVCGRFGGIDQRFIDSYVDEEVSVGDFVMAGGELAALMMADSLLRHVPGVLGNADSAAIDSFSGSLDGGLEHPLYTQPREFQGLEVPPVLLSGDHQKIEEWRRNAAREKTRKRRPDLVPPRSK